MARGTGLWVGVSAAIALAVVLAILGGYFIGRGSRQSNSVIEQQLVQQRALDLKTTEQAVAAKALADHHSQVLGEQHANGVGFVHGKEVGFRTGEAQGISRGEAIGESHGREAGEEAGEHSAHERDYSLCWAAPETSVSLCDSIRE